MADFCPRFGQAYTVYLDPVRSRKMATELVPPEIGLYLDLTRGGLCAPKSCYHWREHALSSRKSHTYGEKQTNKRRGLTLQYWVRDHAKHMTVL
ncbi:hypothetical protein PoB_000631200 [Plakobranchus ocellatus]|uniref:Uncharacterized protein n=1 Tax=Plakobranchus ocellatus TaxID=259542 RepID=A0AAV3YCI1_9GAST|nr:hypothetical protein PoB_000631200 [Plakobranchus ocellatus]